MRRDTRTRISMAEHRKKLWIEQQSNDLKHARIKEQGTTISELTEELRLHKRLMRSLLSSSEVNTKQQAIR